MKALLAAALFGLVANPAWALCAEDKVSVFGDWGQATFTIELADDPQERAKGLMFVEQMATLEGMLFIYEEPQRVSFWMKNTLIPLDMLFVGPSGEVLTVHENAVPGDLTAIPGGDGVLAVLEINGGLAARLGIAVGDVLQHPRFGDDAILPCEQTSES